VSLVCGLAGLAGAAPGEGRLKLVEAVPRDDLAATVGVAISPDGKFVYSASWQAATATVFARDRATGKLEHKQTVADELLEGVTTLAIGADGRLAVASAFGAKTAVLFGRDPGTGALKRLHVARDGEAGVRLAWPIDVALSADSKFAYVLDDRGGEAGRGAVAVFRINDGKLELAGTDEGTDGCYAGGRGIVLHPDGKTVYVASSEAGTLVVADRDPATGLTKVRQVIKDGQNNVHALAGAMGVAVSPDGKSVYVSAGRFHGDDAVSAFRVEPDGKLTLLQEFVDGAGELQGFKGGNHLAVSPDGRNVYATATGSGAVASFARDPATGKLTYLDTLPDGGEGGANGAAGAAISPDGRYVYVATEDHKTISVFERDAFGFARR
jgi:DNA-binding beta-propeller fold protein YncE